MGQETEVKRTYSIKSVLLTSWAVVSTALLVGALIGGAIYLNAIKETCEDAYGDGQQRCTRGDKYGDECLYLNEKQKTELYYKKNEDGAITMIVAVDYKKKISATYIAGADYCLLNNGDNKTWHENWNINKLKTDIKDEEQEKTVDLHFELDEDSRVPDSSVIPSIIRPFCEGKTIYWLKEKETGVEKRHIKPSPSPTRFTVRMWMCWWTDYCGDGTFGAYHGFFEGYFAGSWALLKYHAHMQCLLPCSDPDVTVTLDDPTPAAPVPDNQIADNNNHLIANNDIITD